MIRLCCLLLFALPLYVNSQFSDDFNDGDFTHNPPWFGDSGIFEIDTNLRLHLKDTAAGEASLSTASTALVNASWEVLVELQFNPSASNLARVYLASDQTELSGDLNGYYVEIGGANDEISLYRQAGSSRTKLIDGYDDRVDQGLVRVRIRASRDGAGNWELWSDTSGGFNYELEGLAFDNQAVPSAYAGVSAKYTITRADKFYFDEFQVTGDPFVVTVRPFIPFGSVVINEVFANPEPQVGLPKKEFVELLNASKQSIDLSGWTFSDAVSSRPFPTAVLEAGAYAILCAEADTALFNSFGKTIALSTLPTLNNDGDELAIYTERGNLVHYIAYSKEWYNDDVKDNGGYSLEMIDPNNPCAGDENWSASKNDRGGSPGKRNSIHGDLPDNDRPALVRIAYVDSQGIALYFSEPLDSLAVVHQAQFEVTPVLGQVILVQPVPPDFTVVQIRFQHEMDQQQVYALETKGIFDCARNEIVLFNRGSFGKPQPYRAGDLTINEILFNPESGGSDFLELYNISGKVLDLSELWVFEVSTEDKDSLLEESILWPANYLSFAYDHIVLTADAKDLSDRYAIDEDRLLLEVDAFPNFPDDEGVVRLFHPVAGVIDELHYSKNWHFPLLADKNGVSLEKLSPLGLTQDPNNWHSAASTVDYATPTYSNSQSLDDAEEIEVWVSPEVFTPDQDGQQDLAAVHYRFDEPGYVANVRIFDHVGRQVNYLLKNQLVGREGKVIWNGLNEGGEKAGVGIYLVYFEALTASGNVKKFKKNIAIGGKF